MQQLQKATAADLLGIWQAQQSLKTTNPYAAITALGQSYLEQTSNSSAVKVCSCWQPACQQELRCAVARTSCGLKLSLACQQLLQHCLKSLGINMLLDG
jgi:hypothetical protein